MIGRANKIGQWMLQKSSIPASRVFGGGRGTRAISKALNYLSFPSKIGLFASSPIIARQLICADAKFLLDLPYSLTSSTFAHHVISLAHLDTPFAYFVTAVISAALLIIGKLVKETNTLHGRVKLLEENFKGSMAKKDYNYAFLCIEKMGKLGKANHRSDWIRQAVAWKVNLLETPGLYSFFLNEQKAAVDKRIKEMTEAEYASFCELAKRTKPVRSCDFKDIQELEQGYVREFNSIVLEIIFGKERLSCLP